MSHTGIVAHRKPVSVKRKKNPNNGISPLKGQWDVITIAKGLTRMNASGLINHPNIQPIAKNFTGSNATIHPVFAQANWPGISQTDYDLLKPAIQLASAFLCEPAVVAYFNGMRNVHLKPLGDPRAEASRRQALVKFDLNFDDLPTAFKVVAQLKDCVQWTFGPTKATDSAWATTEDSGTVRDKKDPITRNKIGKTRHSTVILWEPYLEVLRGKIDPSVSPCIQEECQPYDKQAAMMRTIFRLAVTMIHELCHVHHFGEREYLPDVVTFMDDLQQWKKAECEPFFRDHFESEVGQALEQCMFAGTNVVLGKVWAASVPYGLGTMTFPGILHLGDRRPFKGAKADRLYGIKMGQLCRLFDTKFWDHQVNRYDLEAFKFDRTHDMWARVNKGQYTHRVVR